MQRTHGLDEQEMKLVKLSATYKKFMPENELCKPEKRSFSEQCSGFQTYNMILLPCSSLSGQLYMVTSKNPQKLRQIEAFSIIGQILTCKQCFEKVTLP